MGLSTVLFLSFQFVLFLLRYYTQLCFFTLCYEKVSYINEVGTDIYLKLFAGKVMVDSSVKDSLFNIYKYLHSRLTQYAKHWRQFPFSFR